ncbi:hypothetical protein V2S66_00590 [Streptomyces sp. V4-01]|uniref:Uncharacterized protein n=1 Tax=Actinacidiphila polyblastidii TaxID=3110430 RepID=A0ABU7P3S6_9ACTN|nr:hypothetical protein [Streptomyces sp. V4-01]
MDLFSDPDQTEPAAQGSAPTPARDPFAVPGAAQKAPSGGGDTPTAPAHTDPAAA